MRPSLLPESARPPSKKKDGYGILQAYHAAPTPGEDVPAPGE
jgi:hypothetical protein